MDKKPVFDINVPDPNTVLFAAWATIIELDIKILRDAAANALKEAEMKTALADLYQGYLDEQRKI